MRIGAIGALALGLWLGASPSAHADAVDEAFVRGNEAAARQDWPVAVEAYEQAASLLPGNEALLSYNLGTAYAHAGDLGRATYHLLRAQDFRAGPTAEVLQLARENLEVVRRAVELRATSEGTQVDRPQTTWDLAVDAMGAMGLRWVSLLCGWLLGVAVLVQQWLRRRGSAPAGWSGGVVVTLAVLYVVLGAMHAWSLQAQSGAPSAVVLAPTVEAREGPGQHRKVEFTIQGGSRVRVIQRTPGWQQVRLSGGASGLVGWVPEGAVGRLDNVSSPAPARAGAPTASGARPTKPS